MGGRKSCGSESSLAPSVGAGVYGGEGAVGAGAGPWTSALCCGPQPQPWTSESSSWSPDPPLPFSVPLAASLGSPDKSQGILSLPFWLQSLSCTSCKMLPLSTLSSSCLSAPFFSFDGLLGSMPGLFKQLAAFLAHERRPVPVGKTDGEMDVWMDG